MDFNINRLILVAALISAANGNFLIVTDGNYSMGPQGSDYWLKSGPFFLYQNGTKLNTDNATLRKANAAYGSSGLDILGQWQSTKWIFQKPDNSTLMEALIRSYPLDEPNIVIFQQRFPNGLKNCRSPNNNFTISGFPTFRLSDDVTNTSLAYLMFAGYMLGDRSKVYGKWTPSTMKLPDGIDGSGPLVLFDRNDNVLIISFLDNSMAASVWQDGNVLSWGVMGGVDELPAGFSLQTIVYLGNSGVGSAFKDWGRIMREWHGKTDAVVQYHQAQDITLSHLGYWTDNGGYYYYHTEQGKNYEQTLPDVLTYARQQNIPYQYVQIDSWWYPKDKLGAVTTWDAMTSIFPHGLRNLSRSLHLPIAAHNRYWSINTTYAKQNGGKFDFFIGHDLSLPTTFEFWNWLLKSSSQWGLVMYEQDWLNVQMLRTELLQTSITAGADWLDGMARAARDHNMTVQYCMSQSRHALHSMRWPEVTQARVTDDYLLKSDNWRIGVTSHFAAALGLAPSKDTFWTTSVEKGNPFNKSEPYPELQSAVATLSTGPVGPGDAINATDTTNLMRCCAADGLILKPSKPATAIDAVFMEMGFGNGAGTSGEVWTTYTDLEDFIRFGIILAFGVTRSFNITPTAAGFSPMIPEFPRSKIFARNNPAVAQTFSESSSYDIGPQSCNYSASPNFCLFYTSPVLDLSGNEVVLIGELSKWVPISNRRLLTISQTSTTLTLTLGGPPGEKIVFSYLLNGELKNETVTPLTSTGCAKVIIQAPPTPVTTATTHPTTTSSEGNTTEAHTNATTEVTMTTKTHNATTEVTMTTSAHNATSEVTRITEPPTTHKATETTAKALETDADPSFERVYRSPFAPLQDSCRFTPPPFTPPPPTPTTPAMTSEATATSEATSTLPVVSTTHKGEASAVKASSVLCGAVVVLTALLFP